MNPANPSSQPARSERGPERLAAALREQGTPEDEIAPTVAALLPLAEWTAPVPSADETRRLIERLAPYLPATPSPVRQALRDRPAGLAGEFWLMLQLVRAQVSLLLPGFWLASVVVVALGGLLVWVVPNLSRSFILHVTGPLLAYIGTASAFRAGGLNMLEFELACPPSPRQLTLARLTVVLSYDLALGLLLSLLVWPQSGAGFGLLSLHWLAPLLLGVGLTLLLSLRISIAQAAAVTYTGWLVVLLMTLVGQNGVQGAASAIPPGEELALAAAGLALIAAMLAALPRAVAGLLPHGNGS
jgi:hypothetical protein